MSANVNVNPRFKWQTTAPEDQGMSKQKLDALKDGLAARSTKALLVIRNDKIVYEWYSPDHSASKQHYTASMAKALVGGVPLAVAIGDGRIKLDDKAAKYISQWRDDPEKSKITVRHLGSHTSGIEDAEADGLPHEKLTGWKGDFWKRLDVPNDPFTISRDIAPVLFDPGTKFQYSNPGIAMLSYAITAALRDAPEKDLRTLLRDRIMRPIGVPDKEWSVGYGQVFTVDGLPLVAAWGGGGYTARALARVGRLMLRGGDWEGTRLIDAEAVRITTSSAGLPGENGMGWWTNADGRFATLPNDAFWASGAGHQTLLVVPSLNLICVRNGGQLSPRGEGYRDARGPYLFEPLMEAITDTGSGESETYFPPPDSRGGWHALTDKSDIQQTTGMDKSKLDEVFEFIKGSTKNGGLLVVRRGWLVYERYFGKGHHDAAPNLASCGKSFTSIAVGILMAERPELFPDGLDQKVFTPTYLPPEAFPLSDPDMAEIKLGQLLAFSAGIRGNNPAYVHGKRVTIDPIGPDGWYALVDAIALGKEDGVYENGTPFTTSTLWCEPGGGYSYATAAIHIASIMLRHITGMELQEYVDRHLAKPLGWERWNYAYRYAKRVTHTPGGGGIALRGTDMLRFGYMLLHEGKWNNEQLVPAEYVRHCARQSPYNPHYPYSLQFNVNSDGHISEVPDDAFWKSGSGGHALYVVPSLDLVVWKLGGRDSQYTMRDTGLPEISTKDDTRAGWKSSVNDRGALIKTLKMVIGAIQE